MDEKVAVTAYFDGGAAGKAGTGGFICLNGNGCLLFGKGRWCGKERATVNLAEMQALQDLLKHAVLFGVSGHCNVLNVLGNSKLICDVANCIARCEKRELFLGFR